MNKYQKLLNNIRDIYKHCIITKSINNIILQPIMPLFYIKRAVHQLLFSKYLYIPLSTDLSISYQNFRFTIFPDPDIIFYERINNKTIKGGIFKGIDLNNNIINVALLYNSRVFLKYHFLKFLEINRIYPNVYNYQDKYIYSDLYLDDIIYEISDIDSENIFDYSGNNIML
jgi:hypothetical protein